MLCVCTQALHIFCLLTHIVGSAVHFVHDPKPISPQPLDESRRKELDECIKLHNIADDDSSWLRSLVAGGTGLLEYETPPFSRPTLPQSPQPHSPFTPPLLPPQPLSQAPKKTRKKQTALLRQIKGHSFDDNFYTVEWASGETTIIPRTDIDYHEGNVHYTNDLLDAYEKQHFGKQKKTRASHAPSQSEILPSPPKPAAAKKKK